MTEDELKQEAEEWLCNNLHSASEEDFIKAMVDIAEPREKRIAELERKLKVETELSNRFGLAYREYEQLTKEQDEHLAKLEKENAELKTRVSEQSERISELTQELDDKINRFE